MMNSKMFSLKHIKNRASLVASYIGTNTQIKAFPAALEIEVTNRCNLSCLTCPRDKMQRPLGNMSFELFKHIIDEAKGHVESVLLFHMGEPLLHPQISDMIRYAKSAKIKTIMFTNSMLLSKSKAEEIMTSGLDMLVMSFDGASKQTYEKVRKGADYETVIANIANLVQMKKELKSSIHTQTHFVLSQQTKGELNEFLDLMKKLGVDSVRLKPFINTADIGGNIGETVSAKGKNSRPCIMLWREPVIGWDGSVFPCCVDLIGQKCLGNVNEKPLHEIWNCEEMRELRRKHIVGRFFEEPLCKNCNAFEISPFLLLGTVFVDDFNIRKINPILEKLAVIKEIKQLGYVNYKK